MPFAMVTQHYTYPPITVGHDPRALLTVWRPGVQVGVTKWLKKLEEHFYETAFDFDKVDGASRQRHVHVRP